ncbi:MAG: hypothetical protein NTY47_01975, partial [Candidatus Omnitrophica bacterium]|nr:hypothetical protein [Candidatus Omnitrophota bacterium]
MIELSQGISVLKEFLRRLEFNRTVFFGVMSRMCTVLTGPITALLIASRFTPQLQGYYYTFWNVLALQIFIELGFGVVIIQFASHEWSQLNMGGDGYIVGHKDALSRLSGLGRIALKGYSIGAAAMAIGLGIGGYFFFSKTHQSNVTWFLPWMTLCILTAVNILFTPIWSILEGCNQVAPLYKYRFIQGLCTTFAIWLAILLGAGLWTPSVSVFVSFICACIFLKFKFQNFLKSIFRPGLKGQRIGWKEEIFPMQWRIALSSISGYFVFSLFTPVIFKFHGPVQAGQMGMTWSIIGFIGTIPAAWLIPKVPQFGMLIALKNYKELDRIFFRITKIFILINMLIAVSLWCLVYVLNIIKAPIAARLISPMPLSVFILAQVIMMISLPFSVYLRAHKKEPLLYPSILLGVFIGISTIVLGKLYSIMGVAVGYLVVTSLVMPLFIY